MKVLIVSHYFWPESFRINDMAAELVAQGCEVTVLTGQPNYPDGDIFPGYRALSIRRERHPAGFDVVRVPSHPRRRGNASNLARNYLASIVNMAVLGPYLLRGRRYDVVFVYATSPVLHALSAHVVATIQRAKLVTWVQDLWPESLEVTGFVRNPQVLGAVRRLVSWIYRRNDLLLAQSEAFARTIRAMAGDTPVKYYPNPGEAAFSAPPDRSQPPALTLKPGFNVVFAGNLGTVQSLDTVIDAAELLRNRPGLRFVLVGSGSRLEWLKEQVAARRLENVELPGRFPVTAMPALFEQASALMVSLVPSPIMDQTIPSKVQAYLAAGRPVIASLNGEGARVIEEAGAGIACRAGDAAALAQAVLDLADMPADRRQVLGDAARRFYDNHFEPAMLSRRLIGMFEELTRAAPLSAATRLKD
ncbi:glycosyltransferase family 4 protein [Roseateles sp. DC23W]|uniref:Glycosyltransferase family 4 protein n=1 Tax=Pelomonas dachongensis TaxID=3299029 RepID=A0ABW7EQM8_9BURK